jgi:hypothetical protein
MGVTPEWVRSAIGAGVTVDGQVVKLEAETLAINGRNVYRIHLGAFRSFLRAIGWKRLPARSR